MEQLITQRSAEAFAIAILPWALWRDAECLYADLSELLLHCRRDKLRHAVQAIWRGGKGQGKSKRLRKVYVSEVAAKQAADAENSRLARAKAKCTIKLAYGRPDTFPERPITLTGFKAEIDAAKWIVAECSHNMDGSGGLQSSLTLEAVG